MSLFDGFKSAASSAFTSVLPQALTTAVNTKVAEAAAFVSGSFGNKGPFKKIGAQAEDLSISASRISATGLANDLAGGGEKAVVALDELSRRQASDAWTNNTLTATEATQRVMDAIDADVSARTIDAEKDSGAQNRVGGAKDRENYKVRLVGIGSQFGKMWNERTEIVFDIMPEITESRNVDYEAVQPAQSPGAFQKYKGTNTVEWTVNALFVSRTSNEAYKHLMYLNQLRAWTMPFFGTGTQAKYKGRIGAPPAVLTFSGWREKMVGPVEVVITSLNWTFQQDVDYIPAIPDPTFSFETPPEPIPFPTILRVTIQLRESFSTEQFNRFDLDQFALGNMSRAFPTPGGRVSEVQTVTEPGVGAAEPEQQQGEVPRIAGSDDFGPPPYTGSDDFGPPPYNGPGAPVDTVANVGGDNFGPPVMQGFDGLPVDVEETPPPDFVEGRDF